MNYKNILKSVLSYLIVIVIFFLLYREFKENWTTIRAHDLKFDPFHSILAFAAMLATYFLTTYGWHLALNALSSGNRLSFRDSVAIVNTSSLTKYLPGKVWSFALQTYWLGKEGFASSLVVFVYLINMLTLIVTFLIVGFFCLAVSPGELPFSGIVFCLAGLVVLDILFILYGSKIFKALVSVVGKIVRQEIAVYEAPKRLLLRLHSIHAVSAVCFGMSGYYLSFGIGFALPASSVYSIVSAMIVPDMIGFLSFIVPSGLGVREGIMYLLLKGDAFGTLSLILPVASRIAIIAADVLLGAIGFVLLRDFKSRRGASTDGKQAL